MVNKLLDIAWKFLGLVIVFNLIGGFIGVLKNFINQTPTPHDDMVAGVLFAGSFLMWYVMTELFFEEVEDDTGDI